jgi:hypothetical protein
VTSPLRQGQCPLRRGRGGLKPSVPRKTKNAADFSPLRNRTSAFLLLFTYQSGKLVMVGAAWNHLNTHPYHECHES